MMRTWIAVALLSVSWMLGLQYYTAANGWFWAITVLTALVLGAESPRRLPNRIDAILAVALVLPTAWLLPWPYRFIPLALAVGLGVSMLPGVPKRLVAIGWGTVRSSLVLLAQAIILRCYSVVTTRSHDLPWPGAELIAIAARLLGAQASADGAAVAIYSPSGPLHLVATWQLVLDPITVAMAVGAVTLVTVWAWEDGIRGWKALLTLWGRLGLVFIAWLPIRLALLLGLYLHRHMRAPADLKLTVMDQFLSPWVLGAATAGFVLWAWWFVRRTTEPESTDPPSPTEYLPLRRRAVSVVVVLLLIFVGATLLLIEPIGAAKSGRVAFVERHSDWEPTDRAYDTEDYGEDPSYSYTSIYRYCGQYFDVSRIDDDEPINHERLAKTDVLVIKTPTEAYEPKEIRAVLKFVERGGGLLLVGEHTDFERISTYLNPITSPIGFKFRPDVLFSVDDPYVQHVTPRRFPHPAVRQVPPMMYAGSCSVDPGWSVGRAAVWNTGLWSLRADYNMSNFFPEARYHAHMRYGAYIQLWETRYGRGRVLAFTDSTIFSNFSTFEPGKTELMLDMLTWLNHRSLFDSTAVRVVVRLLGLAALAAAVWFIRLRCIRADGEWLLWLACLILGPTAAAAALTDLAPKAAPSMKHPLPHVVLDRTVSHVPLSAAGFTDEANGYGLVEQWISRLGYVTSRAEGRDAFAGDALLILSPTGSVSETYRRQLVDYVESGGKLIVFDSPDRAGSTANSLLWPFGLSSLHATDARGTLQHDDRWPALELMATCRIDGGEPLFWVGETPVAARTRHGQGTVTAIGFGALMNNQAMGGNWMAEPGDYQRLVFTVLYELIQSSVEDRPIRAPAADTVPGDDAASAQPAD